MQAGRFRETDDEGADSGRASANLGIDFSLTQYLKQADRGLLTLLYDPARLNRILENQLRSTEKALRLEDYLDTVTRSVWKELEEKGDIAMFRRTLQREHLAQITDILLKPSPAVPDDAQALLRYQLRSLEKGISDYLRDLPRADLITRAHLEDCANLIADTLKAVTLRNAK